ncbi:MAG: RNA-binding transcriptional accessory protein [Oscillospiraceae bacterium]|nr:RNA-binding transcriptional accessory protein [Candidatus Ruminococcus equi]
MDYAQSLAQHFDIKEEYAKNVIALLDEGNTIPFIARYRKEMHGSMDDQLIRELSERLEYLRNLDKRKEEVIAQIEAQEKMTDEIREALEKATTLAEVEDIYRPYKPKRKTRASVAKEKGLEPLALYILEQQDRKAYPIDLAVEYVDEEKGVMTPEDALQGALDIIAEICSDNAEIRKRVRNLMWYNATLCSKAADEDKESVYTIYYDFEEPVSKLVGHRVLAIDRGEREGFLKVSINLDDTKPLNAIFSIMVTDNSPCSDAVIEACRDAYTRLIFPSVEREIRSQLTENAVTGAIKVFATNLRQLLMQPPIKGKTTLGLDPGYRTGCKVAVVDETGRVLDTNVIYPTHSEIKVQQSARILKDMIERNKVDIIAIGNGTASRETESFTAKVIKDCNRKVSYAMVSEAGASVYSASKLAAKEFPQFDLTLRSAVSIARRLQDPLAELVKIDPKAIGVGQYQHDMPKKQLSDALDGIVEDCVNNVGADLNTASPSLLSRVAGLSSTVCDNIVKYREENGAFSSRAQLKKVPKLGPKAFEQCAGFLRVAESKNPLDNTGVHPESYDIAKKLIELCECKATDIKNGGISDIEERVEKLGGIKKVAPMLSVGEPTLDDIVKELSKPGRDPRDELPPVILSTDVLSMEDLKEGQVLKGTVRNVIDFGAFVDIGVHQDGLVHISRICNRFIKHPSEVLKVGDIVDVKVLSVDIEKKRISLTMKDINNTTNAE